MGNAYTGEFCPASSIEAIINDGGSLQQLLLRRDLNEKDIYLNKRDFGMNEKYSMLFSDAIPKDNYLLLLFPCHTDHSKRILRTCDYSSVVKLNQEINQRLSASLDVSYDYETSKLVIITSNIIYKVYNVVGTGYIIWCDYLNTVNHNNVVSGVMHNVPVFVHMDGYNVFQDVLIIRNRNHEFNMPLNVAKCTFFVPVETFFWTNEHDPRKVATTQEKINVVTTQEAIDACSDDVEDEIIGESIQREQLPFSVLVDSDAETTNEYEASLDCDMPLVLESPTPRNEDIIFSTFVGTDYLGPDEKKQ